jgi:hypothetical protein
VDDFDASELGIEFDLVLSHSVLSRCAYWQLEIFLRNVGKVLAPGGTHSGVYLFGRGKCIW